MYSAMATFIDRLDSTELSATSVLPWTCPVPFFGELATATVATVGLNPSDREFLDDFGEELTGPRQRLPTLRSLNRSRWDEVDSLQVKAIYEACRTYFRRNPYGRWFGVLQRVLSSAGHSLYADNGSACHLDLVAYATATKWGSLPPWERRTLLGASADALGRLIRDSAIRLLILNGQSVINCFHRMSDANLEAGIIPSWSLCRETGRAVQGVAYIGTVANMAGVELWRPIRVIGYNHNLQSSFGVTSEVVAQIGEWVGGICESEVM